jgi:hypothetical protein
VVGDGPVEMGNGTVYTMDSQKDSRIQSAYCEFQVGVGVGVVESHKIHI